MSMQPKGNFVSERLMRLFCTPKRCHVVSGSIACVLIAATSWMNMNGAEIFRDRDHSETQVAESARLISRSVSLRDEHESETELSKRRRIEVAQIKQWLPESIDWGASKRTIKQLAEKADVQLFAVEKKSNHSGTRVDVLSVKCELNGTYAQVCDFIHSLASHAEPIWCDSILLRRNDDVSEPGEAIRCDVTLSLRLPFVGSGTAADKLFHGETSNAI